MDGFTMTTDLELLQRWKAGDKAAGERLFSRYFDSLHGFFRAKTGPGDDDLVQETFLATLEGIDRFRGEGSFRGYLFGIARNILYAHYRRKKRHQDRGIDPLETSLADLVPSVTERYQRREEHRLLCEAAARLPLDVSLTVTLHLFQGLTFPEIGTALDIPLGTAKSQYRRAKQRLAAKIEELGRSGPLITSTTRNLDAWAAEIRREHGLEAPDPDEST
jgi:RNA polymerase sigma-70 factor (ECF subfamily)